MHSALDFPVPSNWTSKGQRADRGHGRSTGTLPGQPVGSELFLQSLNDASDPARPAATFIFSSLQSQGENSEDFQGRSVHSPLQDSLRFLLIASTVRDVPCDIFLHAYCDLNTSQFSIPLLP